MAKKKISKKKTKVAKAKPKVSYGSSICTGTSVLPAEETPKKAVIPDAPPSQPPNPTLDYLKNALILAKQTGKFVAAVNLIYPGGQKEFKIVQDVATLEEITSNLESGYYGVELNIPLNPIQLTQIVEALSAQRRNSTPDEPPKYTFFQKLKNLFS